MTHTYVIHKMIINVSGLSIIYNNESIIIINRIIIINWFGMFRNSSLYVSNGSEAFLHTWTL